MSSIGCFITRESFSRPPLCISSIVISDIFKRPKTAEELLSTQKLGYPKPQPPPSTEFLYAEECVPTKEDHGTSPEHEDDVIIDREIPIEELEESNAVPTLEEDDVDDELDESMNKSVLKSPETPEAEPFFSLNVNEDSMGFDGLAALNFDTPTIQSTQTYHNIVSGRPSPIQRKVSRDAEEEPLNSTQAFFDITRHYKLLSNERKKVLFGEQEEEVDPAKPQLKPVRRRLFDGAQDQQIENTGGLDTGVSKIVIQKETPLESFEEAWEETSVLKPNCKPEKLKNKAIKLKIANPFVLKKANLHPQYSEAETFQTPKHLIVRRDQAPVQLLRTGSMEVVETVEIETAHDLTEQLATETPEVVTMLVDTPEIGMQQKSAKPRIHENNNVPECQPEAQKVINSPPKQMSKIDAPRLKIPIITVSGASPTAAVTVSRAFPTAAGSCSYTDHGTSQPVCNKENTSTNQQW